MPEILKKSTEPKSVGELFKDFLKQLKSGNGKEAFKRFTEIFLGVISGKLLGLKAEVEKRKQEVEQKKAEEKPEDKKEEQKPDKEPESIPPSSPKPASPPVGPSRISSERLTKFRQGEIFNSLTTTFENTEVETKLVPLKTAISKPRPGAPDWTPERRAKSTPEWDYKKAGNTEEEMKEGSYRIEGTVAPESYSRSGPEQIPSDTKAKLTAIARALLADKRMPLFSGIAMTVDGVEVMMVKEIHMHPRGSSSDYLCQPHQGVSYIIKTGGSMPVA